jgi:hypothetical protein
MTTSARLTPLSAAGVGETVEVRAILFGAGEAAAVLRPGDLLTCRGATEEWLVVARPGFDELPVSRRDAERVQIASRRSR